MKQIGLTQRVEVVSAYGERRDCLDQQWSALLNAAGFIPVLIPNNWPALKALLDDYKLDGFILTGGNDLASQTEAGNTAPERDRTEKIILDYASQFQLPLLGICRGMQMINNYLGGKLAEIKGHVALHHQVESRAALDVLTGYERVNSFHNWAILEEAIGEGLEAAVFAGDDSVEAFYHRSLPWVGIMWHPERENPFNRRDLNLFKWLFAGSRVVNR